jgi:DNA-binding transcriptional LysR family regulator
LNLFCSPEHPFAKILKINDLDLLKAKWILREPGSGTRQTFNRAMHGLIPKIKILLELKETEAIKRAVKQNIGIGCLSEISLREEFERGDLVRIETFDRDFSRKLYLILHKQKHISSSLKNWIDLCEKLHSKSS